MFDAMTEMISHMIGIFNTTVEEERMRDDFNRIQAYKKADPELNPLLNVNVTLHSGYKMEDFNPKLAYAPPAVEATKGFSHHTFWAVSLPSFFNFTPDFYSSAAELFPVMLPPIYLRPFFTLEPPGSVVTVTYQSGVMYDDDLMVLTDSASDFMDPEQFLEDLESYVFVAQALQSAPSLAVFGEGEDLHDAALTLHEEIGQAEGSDLTGAVTFVAHGSDAAGAHQNGETIDPEDGVFLDDVMPAFQQQDVTEPQEEAPDPFEGMGGPSALAEQYGLDDGHEVVTGANTVINDAGIYHSWLDAPVISVMGDVVNLNVIAQVNLLVEHTDFAGEDISDSSATFNGASIAITSSASEEETPEDAASGLPSNWAVTTIEGDLLTFNWVQQFTFMTDHDRADIQFNSSNTYIGLGDNTIANVFGVGEIGYGFDLIMVGGNMITVNQIHQTNVLIDNDSVTYTGNVPFDFSGADNLLFNGASIAGVGIDSYTDMQDNFAAASADLADGGLTIDTSVAHDSVFEGVDILRVLFVEGDFATINSIDQINVMGDSDQVHLALDNLEGTQAPGVTVTTGSNAAINLASIQSFGVDSTVAVGGDVYDDAFLYQAELIDTDASPLGVDLPALASEAVVFLADDMMTPEDSADPVIVPTAPEYSNSADSMQTMLA